MVAGKAGGFILFAGKDLKDAAAGGGLRVAHRANVIVFEGIEGAGMQSCAAQLGLPCQKPLFVPINGTLQ